MIDKKLHPKDMKGNIHLYKKLIPYMKTLARKWEDVSPENFVTTKHRAFQVFGKVIYNLCRSKNKLQEMLDRAKTGEDYSIGDCANSSKDKSEDVQPSNNPSVKSKEIQLEKSTKKQENIDSKQNTSLKSANASSLLGKRDNPSKYIPEYPDLSKEKKLLHG